MVSGVEAADATGSVREPTGAVVLTRRLAATLLSEHDRWFLWTPVLFGIGIFCYFRLSWEPNLLAALMPALAVLGLAPVLRRGALAMLAVNGAIALTLGFGAAKVRTEWVAAPVLERQLKGVEVEGFVELVEPRPAGQRLTIRVTKLGQLEPEKRPHRVRIRIMTAMPDLRPGDAIRLNATLAPPSMPALAGDYDFARAAWFSGLGGVGYARACP